MFVEMRPRVTVTVLSGHETVLYITVCSVCTASTKGMGKRSGRGQLNLTGYFCPNAKNISLE